MLLAGQRDRHSLDSGTGTRVISWTAGQALAGVISWTAGQALAVLLAGQRDRHSGVISWTAGQALGVISWTAGQALGCY